MNEARFVCLANESGDSEYFYKLLKKVLLDFNNLIK